MSTTPLPKELETVTSTDTTPCGCKYVGPNSYDPSYDDGCGWGAYCPGSSIHEQVCSDEAPCPSHSS